MRPFSDIVRELAGGEVLEEATAGLTEAVAAVMRSRKAGKVTLELAISPNGENTVKLKGKVKVSAPDPVRGETIFYATQDGSLVRDNPAQERLPLRDVTETAREVRDVATEKREIVNA
jgi:hypothetical protein